MRVENRSGGVGATSVGTARKPEAGRSFSLGAEPPAARTGAASAAATLAGLDAVLMLQSEPDTPSERRRRTVRRGSDLLDGLDRLKASLLSGRVATDELLAIAGRLSERADASGDPRLDGLIADIELRAAVELAKVEAARGA
ncbi:flagellar assembly protein FliX [uncultured Methylobacterium sp.]|uniref:flagellar assembly protein FliX n=1 Tax=uncultured Methylobacterium sp. TaxID=157278 RepID=UPI0035CAE035